MKTSMDESFRRFAYQLSQLRACLHRECLNHRFHSAEVSDTHNEDSIGAISLRYFASPCRLLSLSSSVTQDAIARWQRGPRCSERKYESKCEDQHGKVPELELIAPIAILREKIPRPHAQWAFGSQAAEFQQSPRGTVSNRKFSATPDQMSAEWG